MKLTDFTLFRPEGWFGGGERGLRILLSDFKRFNLLLTEREGPIEEYWPEVMVVRTDGSEVRAKTTEGQYSSLRS